jgi:polar amino acid transport system substrate-binding protein
MKRRYVTSALVSSVALLLLVAGCSSNSKSAAANGELAAVLAKGTLIVGTGSDNAPWHFKDKSGNLVGFDIDVAKIIAKGLFNDPSKVQFIDQTSDSRIPNVLTGKVDITCQFMTVTAARAQQVAFTIPYYREGVGLLLPNGGKYKDFAALKAAGSKVTVSILQNTYAADLVHTALPLAKVDQYNDVALIYSAVNSGRADAAASDQSSVSWFIAQDPTKYHDSGYGWSPQTYACAVKPGDQVWLNFVNQALHEAMTGVEFDSYAASFKKWFGVTLPTPQIGFPVEYK